MINKFRVLLLVLSLSAAVMLGVGCPPGGDDDDSGTANDDDSTAGDDDDVVDDDDSGPFYVEIALGGEVIVVDPASGAALTDEEYLVRARGGKMAVYLVEDPADLSAPLAKFVLETPGSWSTVLFGDGTVIYAVVVVDDNGNRIIEQSDLLREHSMNPRTLDQDLPDLDITVELAPLPTGGGGGGSAGPCSNINGVTVLLRGTSGEIAVTAHSSDLGAGPYEETYLSDAGEFDICIRDTRQYTSLLGIHDTDGNTLFEPSDDIGEAQINPIALGIGDVVGAVIEIPSATPITLPAPPPYITLDCDIVFPGYTSGDITVYSSVGSTVYSTSTIPAPGGVSLRSPPNTDDVRVWAVVDQDGNGSPNPIYEPNGQTFIDTLTFDVQGLLINIEDPTNNSISGTVVWSGLVSSGDSLQIALHDDPEGEGTPVAGVTITNPVFPQVFSVPGLLGGTYYVTGYLDVGGAGGGASLGEPLGIYEDTSGQPEPVVLSGNSHPANIDFILFESTPPSP